MTRFKTSAVPLLFTALGLVAIVMGVVGPSTTFGSPRRPGAVHQWQWIVAGLLMVAICLPVAVRSLRTKTTSKGSGSSASPPPAS